MKASIGQSKPGTKRLLRKRAEQLLFLGGGLCRKMKYIQRRT